MPIHVPMSCLVRLTGPTSKPGLSLDTRPPALSPLQPCEQIHHHSRRPLQAQTCPLLSSNPILRMTLRVHSGLSVQLLNRLISQIQVQMTWSKRRKVPKVRIENQQS